MGQRGQALSKPRLTPAPTRAVAHTKHFIPFRKRAWITVIGICMEPKCYQVLGSWPPWSHAPLPLPGVGTQAGWRMGLPLFSNAILHAGLVTVSSEWCLRCAGSCLG